MSLNTCSYLPIYNANNTIISSNYAIVDLSLNILGLEISLNINLTGQSSLFIGITRQTGVNSNKSKDFLISINAGALVAIAVGIILLLNRQPVPTLGYSRYETYSTN